jgi:hypothetical protein
LEAKNVFRFPKVITGFRALRMRRRQRSIKMDLFIIPEF